jgi:hypothetical protein
MAKTACSAQLETALKIQMNSQVLVGHACNPSHSGGRDQEHHGSKPAPENSSQDPILTKPYVKRLGRVTQVIVST